MKSLALNKRTRMVLICFNIVQAARNLVSWI